MIRVLSEKDLLDAFRPIDRDEVMLPSDLKFPFLLKDYLAWNEPSGYRAFIVFVDPSGDSSQRTSMGLVLRRDQSAGPGTARMCEWCHMYGSGDDISLLSATVSANRRIGVSLHRDLSCKQRVADMANAVLFAPGSTDHSRVKQVLGRISTFARRALF